MSLIEEALRRVKDPTLSKTVAPPAVATPPSPTTAAQSPAHSWSPADPAPAPSAAPQLIWSTDFSRGAWTIILIAAGLFFGYWVLNRRPSHAQPLTKTPATTSTSSATIAPPSTTTLSSSQALALQPQAAFVLNGIVGGSGEPYAMIDGKLLHIGQSIHEWTILSIGQDAVTLQGASGKMRTLHLAN